MTVTSPRREKNKMKIRNPEKYRDTLYKAIDDAALFDFAETPLCVWKDGHERPKYADQLQDFDAEGKCISLPHPFHIKGSNVWMIIDHDGDAIFYLSHETHFQYLFSNAVYYYDTQMAHAIAVTHDLYNLTKKYDEEK